MNGVPRIHHVALVVNDLQAALAFWHEVLGLPLAGVQDIPEQQSRIAFLPAGEAEVELVLPTSDDSGIARYLAKRGPGMHHLCLEVRDLDALLQRLQQKGIRLINPEPLTGADGRRMAFVHPDSTHGVLLELYELPQPES